MLRYSLRCFARLRRNPVQRAFYSNAESNTRGSQNRTYLPRPLRVFLLGAQAPRLLSCIKCVCCTSQRHMFLCYGQELEAPWGWEPCCMGSSWNRQAKQLPATQPVLYPACT